MSCKVFKDSLFLYASLCVTKTVLSLQLVMDELLIHHTPLPEKLAKIRIYECVKSILVDSNFFLYLCTR